MKHPMSIGGITRDQVRGILDRAESDYSAVMNQNNLQGFDQRDIENLIMGGNLSPRMMSTAKHNVRQATPDQVDRFLRDLLSVRGSLLKKVVSYLDSKGIRTEADLMGKTTEEKREILDVAVDFAYETVGENDDRSEKKALKEEMLQQLLMSPLKLQRPSGSSKHHLMEFIKSYSGVKINEVNVGSYQSFVVEHDWLAAFAGTPDFDGDEIPPLPFEKCCFEFLVNGVRILAFVGMKEDESLYSFLSIGYKGRWYGNREEWRNGELAAGPGVFASEDSVIGKSKVIPFIRGQIRAVCIMLDAEVAVREVRRVSEKLNRSRARSGKTPLKDYHVVSLARKFRADRTESATSGEHARKRCHWRRGHWRHYADHKTWIKWMLVGDPALGFVEKSYRA